jgi:hypothetical protein
MEDGSVLWDGFFLDVTERKEEQEALLGRSSRWIAPRTASFGSTTRAALFMPRSRQRVERVHTGRTLKMTVF